MCFALQVSGSWAEWGEWSQCNALCGLGRMTRDRTCTDPSPVFGGLACEGPGSDLTHCFAGPCMGKQAAYSTNRLSSLPCEKTLAVIEQFSAFALSRKHHDLQLVLIFPTDFQNVHGLKQ